MGHRLSGTLSWINISPEHCFGTASPRNTVLEDHLPGTLSWDGISPGTLCRCTISTPENCRPHWSPPWPSYQPLFVITSDDKNGYFSDHSRSCSVTRKSGAAAVRRQTSFYLCPTIITERRAAVRQPASSPARAIKTAPSPTDTSETHQRHSPNKRTSLWKLLVLC